MISHQNTSSPCALEGKSILLVISGGISAYKSLELIRLLKKSCAKVRCILTRAGAEFVTPLSVAALSGEPVYQDLFSLKDETEMGHIQLSRDADLIVVAPASADLISKMAQGRADDLASTTLLASNKQILLAPAMNREMWAHKAVQRNITALRQDNIQLVGPSHGDLACGETGAGRMSEPQEIFERILSIFHEIQPLQGLRALVTSGPTYEPIDPVRFIGNRSSGKQGHAIASFLLRAGAIVTLVSGPTSLEAPTGVQLINVETAEQMKDACLGTLPVDIAVCAAAVADWRVLNVDKQKIKKITSTDVPKFELVKNEDILSLISQHPQRPKLVIGFAAETENLAAYAEQKLRAKGCDWIVANNVTNYMGTTQYNVFGANENQVTLLKFTNGSVVHDAWPLLTKLQVAQRLTEEIINHLTLKF